MIELIINVSTIGVEIEMLIVENYFLSFLEKIAPTAAQCAKKMDDLIFDDPSSAMTRARLFIESIIENIWSLENLEKEFNLSLFDKIDRLSREGYIERDIQKSLDTIRLIGNKATHDASFNDIEKAFIAHKEVYKIGVWYYEVYSSEQLFVHAYETPSYKKEDIEGLVKQHVSDLLKNMNVLNIEGRSLGQTQDENDGKEEKIGSEEGGKSGWQLQLDLPENKSYLERELNRLKASSQEAVENAEVFSQFKKYMHVEREIQLEIERILKERKNDKNNLTLLCGSVGDGKSHLLAYINSEKHSLIENYSIYNDATESYSPTQNSMETLEAVLKNFSDQHIESSEEHVILAINMGVLHNFIYREHEHYTFERLKSFVEKSELFSQKITTSYNDEHFDLLSFGDYHTFELTEHGPESRFYMNILQKICAVSNQNPFYLAAIEDEKRNINTIIHKNYRILQNQFVQQQIVQIIIRTMLQSKIAVSSRAFLNMISDLLIPDDEVLNRVLNDFETLQYSLPNLLFNRRERSNILSAIQLLNPINNRTKVVDEIAVSLNTLQEWDYLVESYINDNEARELFRPFHSKETLTDDSFNQFFDLFICTAYLTNKDFVENTKDEVYLDYVHHLYNFNKGIKKNIGQLYAEVADAIFKWKGTPQKGYLYLNELSNSYLIAQKLDLIPSVKHLEINSNQVLHSFKKSIQVVYEDDRNSEEVSLEIDFILYTLLRKVNEGYCPTKKDLEDAIKFSEFLEKMMKFGQKKKEILVKFMDENMIYSLKVDAFGSHVFERL
ncbi:DNA phosphorothioation-dependent restriction protein DptF [Viridibacillus arvi]|uniref:DNA phosphorothioation-dependent restriction protein DptF n=1 Tax=Viridibacillus arvi TaxID=263475 RepID=UPI0034CF05E8